MLTDKLSFKNKYNLWADSFSASPISSGLALNYSLVTDSNKEPETYGCGYPSGTTPNKCCYKANSLKLALKKDSIQGWTQPTAYGSEYQVKDAAGYDLNSLRRGWIYRKSGQSKTVNNIASVASTRSVSSTKPTVSAVTCGFGFIQTQNKLQQNTDNNSKPKTEGLVTVFNSENLRSSVLNLRTVEQEDTASLSLAPQTTKVSDYESLHLLTEVSLSGMVAASKLSKLKISARSRKQLPGVGTNRSSDVINSVASVHSGMSKYVVTPLITKENMKYTPPVGRLWRSTLIEAQAVSNTSATVLSVIHPAERIINDAIACSALDLLTTTSKKVDVSNNGSSTEVNSEFISLSNTDLQKLIRGRKLRSRLASPINHRSLRLSTLALKNWKRKLNTDVEQLRLATGSGVKSQSSLGFVKRLSVDSNSSQARTLLGSLVSLCGLVGYLPGRESIAYITKLTSSASTLGSHVSLQDSKNVVTGKYYVTSHTDAKNTTPTTVSISISSLGKWSMASSMWSSSIGVASRSGVSNNASDSSLSKKSTTNNSKTLSTIPFKSAVNGRACVSLLHSFPYNLAIKQQFISKPEGYGAAKPQPSVSVDGIVISTKSTTQSTIQRVSYPQPTVSGNRIASESTPNSMIVLSEKLVYNTCLSVTTKLLQRLA